MSQHYSDPSREDEPHALPDVEVFYVTAQEYLEAGKDTWLAERLAETVEENEMPATAAADLQGWYYWYCFPGCLPDSEAQGPYPTRKEAVQAAQEEAAEVLAPDSDE